MKSGILSQLSIKTTSFLTIHFLLFWSVTPVLQAQKDSSGDKPAHKIVSGTINLRFTSGIYKVIKTSSLINGENVKGHRVEMERFAFTDSPGDPILPFRTYDVALPPDTDFSTVKVSVVRTDTAEIPGQFDILPSGPNQAFIGSRVITIWGVDKNISKGRNQVVYAKDKYYPSIPVSALSTSQMRKWKFVRIGFIPVQYNAVRKTLRLSRSVDISVRFTRTVTPGFQSRPIMKDTSSDKRAAEQFINFQSAKDWYRYISPDEPGKTPVDPDYVIITTNAIQTNSAVLASFVTHRTSQGHSVRVVTEDDYGTLVGQAPDGTAEKIRQWLVDNYIPLGIQNVLLIGNPDPDDPGDPSDTVGDIPMKMFWPLHYWPWQINADEMDSPSDYFYADLSGDWDLDGDGFYGEWNSSTNPATPDPLVDPGTYSVRWTGKIEAPSDGNYRFKTDSVGGVRVILDGSIIINRWNDHGPTETLSNSLNLTAGLHDFVVEFKAEARDGLLHLFWRYPGIVYFTSISRNSFYYDSDIQGGLRAEYFNNTDFTAPALSRVDPAIWFYWGAGDRGPGGVDFVPEIYVGRVPFYPSHSTPYRNLDSILQKIIDYENSASPQWRYKFMTANVNLWQGQSDYRLGEYLRSSYAEPMGFQTHRFYESDFSLSPTPECPQINLINTNTDAPCNMLQEWVNGGSGILTWSTHGFWDDAQRLIRSGHTGVLDNTKPTFVFQGSCLNGYPELDRNLGYSLLLNGAGATISATRISWNKIFSFPSMPSGTNANLTYFTTGRIFQGIHAGQALYDTKSAVNWTASAGFNAADGVYMMNLMDFNIYGDPLFRLTLPLMSRITDPQDGSAHTGSAHNIQGVSSGGSNSTVSMVQVSTDLTTWQTAIDTSPGGDWATWTYNWNIPEDGTYTLRSRAIDSVGIIQTPHEITVTIFSRPSPPSGFTIID